MFVNHYNKIFFREADSRNKKYLNGIDTPKTEICFTKCCKSFMNLEFILSYNKDNQMIMKIYSFLQRIHTIRTTRVGAARKEKTCFRSVRVVRCSRGMKKRQQKGRKIRTFFGYSRNCKVYNGMRYLAGLVKLSFFEK